MVHWFKLVVVVILWLTAAKNAIVRWVLNLGVRVLLKGAVTPGPGVLWFHWLAAHRIDIILSEGVRCLWIFTSQKHWLHFRANAFSLNKLKRYVDSTDLGEIWPKHLLGDKEQKCVSDFCYLKYFSRGGLSRNSLYELLDTRTWLIQRNDTQSFWCLLASIVLGNK